MRLTITLFLNPLTHFTLSAHLCTTLSGSIAAEGQKKARKKELQSAFGSQKNFTTRLQWLKSRVIAIITMPFKSHSYYIHTISMALLWLYYGFDMALA